MLDYKKNKKLILTGGVGQLFRPRPPKKNHLFNFLLNFEVQQILPDTP
jgi:hypothetical protein